MATKQARHEQIRALLSRNVIRSQHELRALLLTEGRDVAQSTLSRDLRELGVIKSREGYRLPPSHSGAADHAQQVAAAIRHELTAVDSGGNIVVLRTTGKQAAQEVTARIETARLPFVVAASAIDATVLVVARTQGYARDLVRLLRSRPRRARR